MIKRFSSEESYSSLKEFFQDLAFYIEQQVNPVRKLITGTHIKKGAGSNSWWLFVFLSTEDAKGFIPEVTHTILVSFKNGGDRLMDLEFALVEESSKKITHKKSMTVTNTGDELLVDLDQAQDILDKLALQVFNISRQNKK